MSVERFFNLGARQFGSVGPKLLSDYVAPDRGAELRRSLFGPMFFNSIDWTEVDSLEKTIDELAEYLNDEPVFGIHLWNYIARAREPGGKNSLISLLSDPAASFPTLTDLADRFATESTCL
jgi:hypothetical protein